MPVTTKKSLWDLYIRHYNPFSTWHTGTSLRISLIFLGYENKVTDEPAFVFIRMSLQLFVLEKKVD